MASYDSDDMGQGDAEYEKLFAQQAEEERIHYEKMATDPVYSKAHNARQAELAAIAKKARARSAAVRKPVTKVSPAPKKTTTRRKTQRRPSDSEMGQQWDDDLSQMNGGAPQTVSARTRHGKRGGRKRKTRKEKSKRRGKGKRGQTTRRR